jgi:hypothetical protein
LQKVSARLEASKPVPQIVCKQSVKQPGGNPLRVKYYWESSLTISAKAGWSWGCVATVDSRGRTIFVADAHRDDGRRFVVHVDEKLTAFVELEAAIRVVTS